MKTQRFPLVDCAKYGFSIEPRYFFYGWSSSSRIMAQRGLVQALIRAKKSLPRGYNFKLWDCLRPRAVQLKMLGSFRWRIKFLYPNASAAERTKILFTFGARPLIHVTRPDTHRNGGAIDLTIVNADGDDLYMGTDHDDLTERANTDFFETKKTLTPLEKKAQKNRRLLIRSLTRGGLKNYPREWWHWYYEKN